MSGREAAIPPCALAAGRYELRELIGTGSMGEVWRAVDPRIARPVAVKILNVPPGLSRADEEQWEDRFLREARAAGRLSHPGIVTVHDVGVADDGRPFIVMEMVEGSSLDALMREGPAPSERQVLEWGAQVSEALDSAHRHGIVHRDVKPGNILIDREGRARITDFGIARFSESDLTRAGTFVGSPAFTSPEQIRSGEVDGRSDIFSLGSVLYTLLCGERPFRGEDLASLIYEICHEEPAPPRHLRPSLSAVAERALMKALAKDPSERYVSARELADDLRRAAEPDPFRTILVEAGAMPDSSLTSPGGAPAASGQSSRDRSSLRWRGTGSSRLFAMAGLVALAFCAVMIGAYMLLSRVAPSSGTGSPASADGIPGGGEIPSQRPALPVDPAVRAAVGEPAHMTIRVSHRLSDGLLTVSSGEEQILTRRLGIGRARASLRRGVREWPVRIPPGQHTLRVQVASSKRDLELVELLPATVRSQGHYRLEITVKSWPNPKLELEWKPEATGRT